MTFQSACFQTCGDEHPTFDPDHPLGAGSPVVTVERALQVGPPGVFAPGLGQAVKIWALDGSTSVPVLVWAFDVKNYGRVLVYEERPDQTPAQFHEFNRDLVSGKGTIGCSRGIWSIHRIRGDREALVSRGHDDVPTSVHWLEAGLELVVRALGLHPIEVLALAERV